jgi:hypothetical protein
MAALVVEHHAVSLLPEPAGDGNPDLVTAAPAVRQHDHRGVRAVAGQVPDRQLGAVRCPHDLMVRAHHALAPAERPVPVLGFGTAGSFTRTGEPLVERPGGCADDDDGRPYEQEPAGADSGPGPGPAADGGIRRGLGER